MAFRVFASNRSDDTRMTKSTSDTDQSETTSDTDQSETTSYTDQSESTSDAYQTESTSDTDRSESTSYTDQSESTSDTHQSETTSDTDQSETTSDTDQSETTSYTDQSESTSDTHQSETTSDTDQSEDSSQLDENSRNSNEDQDEYWSDDQEGDQSEDRSHTDENSTQADDRGKKHDDQYGDFKNIQEIDCDCNENFSFHRLRRKMPSFDIIHHIDRECCSQVMLARHDKDEVILKYVDQQTHSGRIWVRDAGNRKVLIPMEIHILENLRSHAMLQHPNIGGLIDYFDDCTGYLIEMPYNGKDLLDYIREQKALNEEDCRRMFKQIIDAVHHLHTKVKIVHRDIRLENITIDKHGKIKLIDFGLAAYKRNGLFEALATTRGTLFSFDALLITILYLNIITNSFLIYYMLINTARIRASRVSTRKL
ncbi:MAG: hypothetical protein Q9164_006356 [Protoblastenia rupestris]